MSPTQYASFSRRFAATILDFFVLVVPISIFGSLIPILGGVAIWFLYAPFLESSRAQATIGKWLVGLQVTSQEGQRLRFGPALVRSFMKLLSGALAFLPHLLALFTSRRQALHDIVAESLVVYGKSEVSLADAWVENIRSVFRADSWFMRPESNLAALERLHALHERGALSREEFEAEKQKILAN